MFDEWISIPKRRRVLSLESKVQNKFKTNQSIGKGLELLAAIDVDILISQTKMFKTRNSDEYIWNGCSKLLKSLPTHLNNCGGGNNSMLHQCWADLDASWNIYKSELFGI